MLVGAVLLAGMSQGAQAGPYQETQICAYKPGSKKLALMPAKTRTTLVDGKYGTEGVVLAAGKEIAWGKSGYTDGHLKPWATADAPLKIAGRSYVRYGLPRIVSPSEVVWFAEKDGVAVMAEKGDTTRDMLFVLHRGLECSFQPYAAK